MPGCRAMSDDVRVYKVTCKDCDLDDTFGEKELAIQHGLDHNSETGHITNVEPTDD